MKAKSKNKIIITGIIVLSITAMKLGATAQQSAKADPTHCSGYQECYNIGYQDGCAYSGNIDRGLKHPDPGPPCHHSQAWKDGYIAGLISIESK